MDVISSINEQEIENFDYANKLLSTCIDFIFSVNAHSMYFVRYIKQSKESIKLWMNSIKVYDSTYLAILPNK